MYKLGENGIPFCLIFTKVDKLKASQVNKNISIYQTEMLESWEEMPTYFITSATKKTGRDEVLHFIEKINEEIKDGKL